MLQFERHLRENIIIVAQDKISPSSTVQHYRCPTSTLHVSSTSAFAQPLPTVRRHKVEDTRLRDIPTDRSGQVSVIPFSSQVVRQHLVDTAYRYPEDMIVAEMEGAAEATLTFTTSQWGRKDTLLDDGAMPPFVWPVSDLDACTFHGLVPWLYVEWHDDKTDQSCALVGCWRTLHTARHGTPSKLQAEDTRALLHHKDVPACAARLRYRWIDVSTGAWGNCIRECMVAARHDKKVVEEWLDPQFGCFTVPPSP